MRVNDEHDEVDGDEPHDDALDEEALEQTTGGTGGAAHELAHTVQQGSGVGANETITVGANRSVSVGTTPKK